MNEEFMSRDSSHEKNQHSIDRAGTAARRSNAANIGNLLRDQHNLITLLRQCDKVHDIQAVDSKIETASL